jgi:soluble lytic murein transglycosylase-like protein
VSRLCNRTHELALQLSQLWRGLPFLFKFQGMGVVAALLVSVAVANLNVHQGYQLVSFALPAPEQARLPWHAEVDAFGQKMSRAFGVRRSTATEFAGWILEASERQGLEPELMASLVLTESSFRKNVRSHVGAIGPAQLRPEFWSGFCGSSNLQDPAENIYCGAQVLSHLKDRCGNEACALEAYNVGIYAQRPRAASRYVAKIDRYREQLRNHTL